MSVHKDASYFDAAIKFNEEARDFFNNLAKELKHPVVRGMARASARQHHEHLIKQKKARYRFNKKQNGDSPVAYRDGKCAPWCKGGHPVLVEEVVETPLGDATVTTAVPYEKHIENQQQASAAPMNESNEENNA